ncbi:MAG: class I SAM-dependent methyltransferase [Gemmatimonadaceae bacterium]
MTAAGVAGAFCVACATGAPFVKTLGRLERCTACGFIAFRDVGQLDVQEIYNEEYFSGAEYPDYLGQESALRRSMRRHLSQMSRFQSLRGSLLEVGCAYGFFLDEARAHFDLVEGVDIAGAPIEHARETLGLAARVGDFSTLDFPRAPFDVVCMWDTIEHLERPDAFVERAFDVLVPKGMLFLTTGDIGSRNARLRGKRWRQIHPPSHLNYFSRHTMSRMLSRFGFVVTGFETAAYYHSLFNILASIRMRGRIGGRLASASLGVIGELRARQVGLWLDLGDTMFIAAQKP